MNIEESENKSDLQIKFIKNNSYKKKKKKKKEDYRGKKIFGKNCIVAASPFEIHTLTMN